MNERHTPLAIDTFTAVLDQTPSLVWVRDLTGRYLFVNRTFETTYELHRENVVGRTAMDVFSTREAEMEAALDRRIIESKKAHFLEQYRALNGTDRRFDSHRFPLIDSSGQVYAVAGISMDAQERHEALQLIERERLRAFQNAKMASIGEMAGGIAHEINNPLQIIVGSSQLLQLALDKQQIDRAEVDLHVGKIVETTQRISEIIRGMTAISRDGDSTALVETDLVPVINDVISLCTERLKTKEIELTTDLPRELMVPCRPVQIGQVLLNLMNNAIYATANSSQRKIFVTAEQRQEYWVLSVRDSGQGVPMDLRQRIFEPFFSTRPVGSGSGLGLSISSAIAQSHGGRLVLNTDSNDTCFELHLRRPIV